MLEFKIGENGRIDLSEHDIDLVRAMKKPIVIQVCQMVEEFCVDVGQGRKWTGKPGDHLAIDDDGMGFVIKEVNFDRNYNYVEH